MNPGGILQQLLSCDWGWRLHAPMDTARCHAQAVRRIRFHSPVKGEVYDAQFCQKHYDLACSLSNPHQNAENN